MMELFASAIIIYGDANGVWSPSHPHLYPQRSSHLEERYIPDTPLTDSYGKIIIF